MATVTKNSAALTVPGDRDEELGGVDCADRLPRILARADQGRGCGRSPTPTPDGVHEASDQTERCPPEAADTFRLDVLETAQDDPEAENGQIGQNEGLHQVAIHT